MGNTALFSRRIFLTAGSMALIAAATEGIVRPDRAVADPLPVSLPELSGSNADATAALAAYLASAPADASIVGDYFLDSELVVPHSVTSLQIAGGSRLKVRGDHTGLTRAGTVQYREMLKANVAAGDSSIAVTGSSYSVGEYILVTTYDVVPNSPDKYGYLRQVTSTGPSSVQVDGAIPRPMVLQPRTAAIALAPSLRIYGDGEITSDDPQISTRPLVNLFAVDSPVVEGIEVHNSGGTGVALAHCRGGRIDCSIHDLLDDGVDHFGYGVNVTGATRGLVVLGTMSRVRHAVTTNAGPSLSGIGPAGEPEDCHFEPTVKDCTDKSVDTHRVGWNTTIVPHIEGGRGGVQIRADNTHVEGGTIYGSSGPGVAVSNLVTVAPTISGVAISYLKPSGTALLCNAPTNVADVSIRDCYGSNIILSNDCVVTGGSISAGGSVGVVFQGSNNVVQGIELGASVLTPYIESAGATNNSFSTAAPGDIEPLPAPVALMAPAITGELAVGQQIRSSAGTWNVGPVTYTYTWLRDGTPIYGAIARTHPKYDIVSADVGKSLAVTVTADRAGYAQGSSTSAGTPAIVGGPPLAITAPPVITGTVEVGKYITVSNGTWSPAAQSWSYAWLVNGAAVSGLAVNRVLIQPEWAGKAVVAQVTAKRTGWSDGVASSAPVQMPAAAITNTALPVIVGEPTVGAFVSVSSGSWTPYVSTRTYEWLVDGVVVAGLAVARVQVKSAWAGKKLTARVTAVKAGWTSTSATSAPVNVAPLAIQNTVRPVITGTPAVGQFITLSKGTWTPTATSWNVAWFVDGVQAPNLAVNRVQVKSAWAGKSVVGRITANRPGVTSASSSSLPVRIS